MLRPMRKCVFVSAALVIPLLVSTPARAATYLWVGGNAGNWGDAAEWGGVSYPGTAADDVASFNNSAFSGGGGNLTLANASGLDASFTIGSISKTSTTANRNFSLNNTSGGSGKLIFQHSSGTATITVSANPNTFTDNLNVPLTLGSNLSVSTAAANYVLRLTKSIDQTGDARSLSKGGTGSLVLRASNSYSGGTTVTAGKLLVDSTGTLGSGDVTVNGGSLEITNTANVIDDTADLSIANGATLNLGSGVLDVVGTLTLGGVPKTAFGTYGAIGSGATYESAFFSGAGFVQVPEPTAAWMLAAGIGMLAARRRHRAK